MSHLDLPLIQRISAAEANRGTSVYVTIRRKVRDAEGKTFATKVESIKVKVPDLVQTGVVLRLRGKGHQDVHGATGDALISLFVDDSKVKAWEKKNEQEFQALFDSLSSTTTPAKAELDIHQNLVLPSSHLRAGARHQVKIKRTVRVDNGFASREELLTVSIPKGAVAGIELRLKGKGHQDTNGTSGDAYLMLVELLEERLGEGLSWGRRNVAAQLRQWFQNSRARVAMRLRQWAMRLLQPPK